MSVIKTSFLLMALTAVGTLHAKKYMTFMGGGGEPQGNDTIFDLQVKSMGEFDAKADWETQISFNGGHSETETLLVKGFRKKGIINTPFTEDSYNKIIQDYEDKINSGAIVKGDQLLLVISTHGAKKKTDKELTHDISVSGAAIQNYDTAEGSSVVSLDKLKNLTTLAESKGIKLGIVDLSCHSGSTIPLHNSSTCVISATGPNHYGYAGNGPSTYTNAFISSMKKGKSLEATFLDARREFTDLSFPMISTPAGLELNSLLYDPLTPYLYSYDPKHDKFSAYIKEQVLKGDACEMPQEHNELLSLISQFQIVKKYSKDIEYYSSDARKFQDTVKKYYAYLDKLRRDYSKLKVPDKNGPKEKFCEVTEEKDIKSESCWEYTLDEILSFKADVMKNYYEKKLPGLTGHERQSTQAALNNTFKIANRQAQLMKENPDYAKRKVFFNDIPDLEKESYRLAQEVALYAKPFYRFSYLNKAAADRKPNPCKDFIL